MLETDGGDVDAVPGDTLAHLFTDLWIPEAPESAAQSFGKGGDIAAGKDLSYPINQVGSGTNAVRDDRQRPSRHRFVDHESPRLVGTGQHQDVCRVVVTRKICLIHETGDNSPAWPQQRPHPVG